MWSAFLPMGVTVLAGVSLALARPEPHFFKTEHATQRADSLVVYRDAVVRYFADNPVGPASVNVATLKAGGYFPTWSSLYSQPDTSIWANYMDANGRIYVYASTRPPAETISQILKLSANSLLVGVYRYGDSTLYSPIYGDTQIPLPPSSQLSIPIGSPVWLAIRR